VKSLKTPLVLVLLAVVLLLSRLPFIGAGYGSDPDAWRLVTASRSLATTGVYEASRLPGFPLQEAVCALAWRGGPLALNGLTAILGIAGVLFFALSLRALGYRDYVLAALALAFTPAVFINSTTSMDYIWALAFVMAGLYFAIVRRPLIAGLMIGLAIGCRITSGAMLIPLAILLVRDDEGSYTPKRVAQLALVACLVGAAAFVPVALTYGPGFFAFYEQQYPSAFDVIKGATEDLWGVVGSLAIAAAFTSMLFPAGRAGTGGSIPRAAGRLHTAAWSAAVVIYFAAYLRLPYEPAYLIPAIPFVFILLGRYLNRKVFIAVCVALIASPFVLSVGQVDDGIAYGDRWQSGYVWELGLGGRRFAVELLGPVFVEHNRRLAGQAYVERILRAANALEQRSVIVAGQWLPKLEVPAGGTKRGNAEFVYLLDHAGFERYRGAGYRIFFLPDVFLFNRSIYDIDLSHEGARDLFETRRD